MNFKNPIKSKTIQGIFTFLVGYAMTQGWIPQVGAEEIAAHLVVIVGAVYGIYGRVTTKGEKLKLKK